MLRVVARYTDAARQFAGALAITADVGGKVNLEIVRSTRPA